MATRRLLRAASAVAVAVGRPSLHLPRSWAAISAAAAEAPQGAAQPSEVFVSLGTFGVPTAVVVTATTGLLYAIQQLGELKAKVAASDKAISDAKSDAATITKTNQDAAIAAIAATEAKLAANEKAAIAVIAATEAKLAANEKAATAVIAANKEVAASAIASTEAKLAAAEKVIAALMAGVSVTAELATLKAMKGEPKRETPKDELKEH